MIKKSEVHQSRIYIIQPLVPHYRISFFDKLFHYYGNRFCVLASNKKLLGLSHQSYPIWLSLIDREINFCDLLYWQFNIFTLPVNKYDTVIINGNPRYLSSVALALRCKFIGVKIIWWGQLWSATSKKWRFKLRLLLMKIFDGIIFYTDLEKKIYLSNFHLGLGSDNCIGLNNGIDTTSISILRSSYIATERLNNILFIGRLTEKSNLSILFNAISIIKTQSIILHIIGDGEHFSTLKELANKLKISHLTFFHGAITEESKISEIANKCILFCYPGSVGLSIIHAMAYGLPAVIHNNNNFHYPEIAAFENNITGATFEHDNLYSLVNCLVSIQNNNDELTKFSINAIDRVNNSFNTNDMSERFINFVK